MPHVIRKRGVLGGTGLAVFLALVHTVNDAITAILGALLPTLQERFDAGPTLLAVIVATYWLASSVTQPLFGSLAEDIGLRVVGGLGVVFAALFLSLIGVAPYLYFVFALLLIGGFGSAALHPVGTAIAGGPSVPNRALGVGFFTAGGMIGFALGPVLILYLVSRFGVGITPWLMIPGLLLGVLVYALLPVWEPRPPPFASALQARAISRSGRHVGARQQLHQRYLHNLHQLGSDLAREGEGLRQRRPAYRLDPRGVFHLRRIRGLARWDPRPAHRSWPDHRRITSRGRRSTRRPGSARPRHSTLLRSGRAWRTADLHEQPR